MKKDYAFKIIRVLGGFISFLFFLFAFILFTYALYDEYSDGVGAAVIIPVLIFILSGILLLIPYSKIKNPLQFKLLITLFSIVIGIETIVSILCSFALLAQIFEAINLTLQNAPYYESKDPRNEIWFGLYFLIITLIFVSNMYVIYKSNPLIKNFFKKKKWTLYYPVLKNQENEYLALSSYSISYNVSFARGIFFNGCMFYDCNFA